MINYLRGDLRNGTHNTRTLLGIDPGLNKTGWGVIMCQNNCLEYVASGVILSNASQPLTDRLANIFNNINAIIQQYDPFEVSIEKTFVNTNPQSSLMLGHARGVAILGAAVNHKKVYEYSANLIKKSVTGQGKATKTQVMTMIKILLPKVNLQYEDEGDALAIAITHNNHTFH